MCSELERLVLTSRGSESDALTGGISFAEERCGRIKRYALVSSWLFVDSQFFYTPRMSGFQTILCSCTWNRALFSVMALLPSIHSTMRS